MKLLKAATCICNSRPLMGLERRENISHYQERYVFIETCGTTIGTGNEVDVFFVISE